MGLYLCWISTSLSNRDNGLMITLLQIFTQSKCQSSGHAVKLVPMRNKAWPEVSITYSNKFDILIFFSFLRFLHILANPCIVWCWVSQFSFKFVQCPFRTGTCNIHHWNIVVDCLDSSLLL